MSTVTMDHVLEKWDSAEHTVEEKLDLLEKHIFEHLGFEHEPTYYEEKGSLLARYAAGFIHRYFVLIKDVSFIVLDPLHIFDIITSFVKGLFSHPLKTVKQIWKVWTSSYTGGAFGLGALTADALLAALIAGAATALAAEGEVLAAAEGAVESFGDTVVDGFASAPRKLLDIGKKIGKAFTSADEFLETVKLNPKRILVDASKSVEKGVSYGNIRSYKLYAQQFMKRQTA